MNLLRNAAHRERMAPRAVLANGTGGTGDEFRPLAALAAPGATRAWHGSAPAADAGLLALRLVAGGLLAGHGAQKLFAAFDGPGLHKTAHAMEHLGLRPGALWGSLAALSELGGGGLLALGLLTPLASIGAVSAMVMAWVKVHWGKPIWSQQGGGELAVLYGAAALGVGLAGPGAYSLDHLLGIEVPRWLVAGATLGALAAAAAGIASRPAAPAATPQRRAGTAEPREAGHDKPVPGASGD